MSSQLEITNLLAEYCERFDAGDLEGFAALFDHRGTTTRGELGRTFPSLYIIGPLGEISLMTRRSMASLNPALSEGTPSLGRESKFGTKMLLVIYHIEFCEQSFIEYRKGGLKPVYFSLQDRFLLHRTFQNYSQNSKAPMSGAPPQGTV